MRSDSQTKHVNRSPSPNSQRATRATVPAGQGRLSDFQIIKKLGDGAYSSVYKAKRLTDGAIYALKQVKMLSLTDKERENALNEVRILASIDEPNVISYKEAFIDEPSSTLILVMEFADNGDLYQKICNY